MALFMFAKWLTFTTKKPLDTSLIYPLKFQKYWIRFMIISKIELKCFEINLMLELFMCLRLELLELLLNVYSLGVIIFFKILIPIVLASFLLFTFSLEFAQFFSIVFPTKIAKLRIFF
jgi:hypothetical protein